MIISTLIILIGILVIAIYYGYRCLVVLNNEINTIKLMLYKMLTALDEVTLKKTGIEINKN